MAPRTVRRIEERLAARPAVREAVGLFAERKDPYVAAADVVAIDATCLQLFRAAEVLRHFFGIQTLVLGVPRNFH